MLHLEKDSKGQDLVIRLRAKDRAFNPFFWQAFLIAFALHATAFLLFHIRPFQSGSSFIFPLVNVQTDLTGSLSSISEQTNFLEEADYAQLMGALPPPPFSMASRPQTSIQLEQPHKQWLQPPLAPLIHQFNSLEQRYFSFLHASPPPLLYYAPIRVYLSGDLAELKIKAGKIESTSRAYTGPVKQAFVAYDVKVDSQSGTIGWFHKKQGRQNKEADRLTEKLLSDLNFEPSASFAVLTGEIGFLIAFEEEANKIKIE